MQCRKCDASMGAVVSGSICRDCVSTPRPMAVSFFRHDLGLPKEVVDKVRCEARDMICTRTIPGSRLVSFASAVIIHLNVIGQDDNRRSFVSATVGVIGDHVPVACTTNILMQGHAQ